MAKKVQELFANTTNASDEKMAKLINSLDTAPRKDGEEKTSAVLCRFVEPMREKLFCTDDFDDIIFIYDIAVTAWNLAILSPHKRPQRLAEILHAVPVKFKLVFRSLFELWVNRKDEEFAEYKWMITDYSVKPKVNGIIVTVSAKYITH